MLESSAGSTQGDIAVRQVQALGAAALGNIVKSLARVEYRDEALLRSISAAVVRLPSSAFDAQVYLCCSSVAALLQLCCSSIALHLRRCHPSPILCL